MESNTKGTMENDGQSANDPSTQERHTYGTHAVETLEMQTRKNEPMIVREPLFQLGMAVSHIASGIW